jgi:hypothetical protein
MGSLLAFPCISPSPFEPKLTGRQQGPNHWNLSSPMFEVVVGFDLRLSRFSVASSERLFDQTGKNQRKVKRLIAQHEGLRGSFLNLASGSNFLEPSSEPFTHNCKYLYNQYNLYFVQVKLTFQIQQNSSSLNQFTNYSST